jgi:hypothetical protein
MSFHCYVAVTIESGHVGVEFDGNMIVDWAWVRICKETVLTLLVLQDILRNTKEIFQKLQLRCGTFGSRGSVHGGFCVSSRICWKINRRFGRTFRLHFQGRRMRQTRSQSEADGTSVDFQRAAPRRVAQYETVQSRRSVNLRQQVFERNTSQLKSGIWPVAHSAR